VFSLVQHGALGHTIARRDSLALELGLHQMLWVWLERRAILVVVLGVVQVLVNKTLLEICGLSLKVLIFAHSHELLD